MSSAGTAAPRAISSPVVILLAAAVSFAVANLAWRFGEGDTLMIVVERTLIGVVLVIPVLWRAGSSGTLRPVLRDRWAMAAMSSEALALIATAFMLRGLTGPMVALVLTVTPAVLLVPTHLIVGAVSRRALPYVLLVVASAGAATLTGGLGPITNRILLLAGLFLGLRMVSIICLERARARHASSVLIACSMVLAGVVCSVALSVTGTGGSWSLSSVIVACAVPVFGTTARMLQTYALPQVGSVVTATTAQVSALLTAIGGVVLFSDQLTWLAATLGVLAAASAVRAIMVGSRPRADPGTPGEAEQAGSRVPARQ